MSEMKSAHGILDIIRSITSNRESGELEISSSGSRGTLLFNEGRLVDAKLGSLTGFQAINAAVSLREVQFSFNPSTLPPRSGSITQNERIVLRQFFGIETVEMAEAANQVDPEIDWNMTPHQVVPLAEVDEIDENELQDTPTLEVRPVISPVLRLPVAVSLMLLVILTAGAIALIPKLKARRQSASMASTVATQPSSVPESSTAEVNKESLPESEQQAERVTSKSATTQSSGARVRSDMQNLTGEWKVINTVKKTAYKSFDNMEIGFRLIIEQTGKDFTAKGEKVSENGRNLPAGSRTPIRVTGSIDGDQVVANFVEDGLMRKTNGRFVWRLQPENVALTGTFISAAANSSGKSAAIKQQ